MHEQAKKLKENKSTSIANSVAQKKNNGKHGFGFVDNRLKSYTQTNRNVKQNHSQSIFETTKGSMLKRGVDTKQTKPIQLQAFKRNSNGFKGELISSEEKNKIVINGWIEEEGKDKQQIHGLLDYHIDPKDNKRLVIGTIKCTPKRTGAGSVLVYLLADKAVNDGMKLMGTDLSALEEGTPEFYMSIGLAPSQERAEQVTEIAKQTPDITGEQIKNMMYSARLDATPGKVKSLSKKKLGTWVID